MGWYRHWFGTPYYKLLYGHRDDAEAAAWVEAIMQRWKLPAGARLLDLACGRGRHARWFTSRGLRVTGADISPESIAEARTLVPGAEFVVHDMRDPSPEARFDAVCCLFTSLGYFDSLTDDQRVFDAVSSMIVPGGCFVVDFMNTEVVLRDLVPSEFVEGSGVRFRIDRFVEKDPAHTGQVVLVKRITADDNGCRHQFEERVQALAPEQLERMAVKAGLVIEDRTDGPETAPFDPERSSRFVLWTRKPEA
ncbi:MAG: class I SAM-dependent methyltransferase [Flavobacteriales bacterium]|nr:class I SAM-dependent methyltransferase [Flavobacteriales bacterium]